MAEPDSALLSRTQPVDPRVDHAARALARRVLEAWTHSGSEDTETLLDDVQRVFLEEANHALRQILFQISARLELALVKTPRTGPTSGPLDRDVVTDLLDAVGRAARIVDTYLDRSRAAQFTIKLHVERFDLAHDVREFLRWNGFLDRADESRLGLVSTPITADRERLRDVLGHLATRFWFGRRAGQRLVLQIHPTADGGAEGFMGLDRSMAHPETLMAEFDHPFTVEAMEIDVPYARAVLERHGGTLYVAVNEDNTIGFGFTLPAHPENTAEE